MGPVVHVWQSTWLAHLALHGLHWLVVGFASALRGLRACRQVLLLSPLEPTCRRGHLFSCDRRVPRRRVLRTPP